METGVAAVSRDRQANATLVLVLVVALALRLWGLPWGLPDRLDFNPDELSVMNVTRGLRSFRSDPHFYSYSGFTYQLFAAVRDLARLARPGIEEPALVLLYRGMIAVFGTATVAILFVLLRRLRSRGPAAPIGAACLALLPLHVWDSHLATTDVALTFWTLAAVTTSVWAYQRPGWRPFVVASALVGVAAGVKFNGALAGVAVAAAALLALVEGRTSLPRLATYAVLGGLATAAALYVASPYTYLEWRETAAAFSREWGHVHNGDYGFDISAPGWQYHRYIYQLAAAFPFSFGIALYAAVLGGLGYAVRRFRRADLIPMVYVVVYLGVTGHWVFVPIRYYLPVEPLLLVPPAIMLAAGLDAPTARLRWLATGALVLVLGYTAAFTLSTTARFTLDTRVTARPWLAARAAEGSSILLVGARWYLPGLQPVPRQVGYLLNYGALPGALERGLPDYLVLTSLHYDRAYRQRDANVELWDAVRQGHLRYRLARRFRSRYLHWRFYRALDPMFEGYFLSPTIEVYQRMR